MNKRRNIPCTTSTPSLRWVKFSPCEKRRERERGRSARDISSLIFVYYPCDRTHFIFRTHNGLFVSWLWLELFRNPISVPKLAWPYDKMNISDSLFEPNDCKCELRKFYVDIRSLKDIVTDPSVKRAMDNPIFKSVNIGMFTWSCP